MPVLLLVNIWAANNAFRENRVRVPYSPFFLQQVRDGNVASITSIGTAVQGRLKLAVRVTSSGRSARDFSTEIPSFADSGRLERLLEQHGVSVNAQPLDKA